MDFGYRSSALGASKRANVFVSYGTTRTDQDVAMDLYGDPSSDFCLVLFLSSNSLDVNRDCSGVLVRVISVLVITCTDAVFYAVN